MDHSQQKPHLPSLVEEERTLLRLPSRPDMIQAIADYLFQKGLQCGAFLENQGPRLCVALHEALSNAIVHGNLEIASELKERGDNTFVEALAVRLNEPDYATRTVEAVAHYDGERYQWTLTDQGCGFDVEGVLARLNSDDPEQLMLASGRGIIMMRAFLDEVRWEAGGRRIVMEVRRAGGEKRNKSRLPVSEPVRVAPVRSDGTVDWDAAYEALARNVSSGGIGILQARLASTDRVLIGVATGGAPMYIPAEVRHLRSVGSNEVELGCRFLTSEEAKPATPVPSPSLEKAIEALFAQLQDRQLAPDERRKHRRVAYTERVEVIDAQPDEASFGYARDLSKGGIALVTTGPLRLEPRVFSLPMGGGKPAVRVRAEVLRCNRIMDGFHDVGARFIDLDA